MNFSRKEISKRRTDQLIEVRRPDDFGVSSTIRVQFQRIEIDFEAKMGLPEGGIPVANDGHEQHCSRTAA